MRHVQSSLELQPRTNKKGSDGRGTHHERLRRPELSAGRGEHLNLAAHRGDLRGAYDAFLAALDARLDACATDVVAAAAERGILA